MRFVAIVVIFSVMIALSSAGVFKASEYASLFAKFTRNFKRAYMNSEISTKLSIFKANLDKITLINAKAPGSLIVNSLADKSTAQYRKMLGSRAPQSLYVALQKIRSGANRNKGNTALALLEAEADINAPVDQAVVAAVDAYAATLMETESSADAESQQRDKKAEAERLKEIADLATFGDAGFDWRSRKVNTAPRNQGDCGSCWAYATIAVAEATLAIKKKIPPPVLSEQHLVDCDPNNNGCGGGWFTGSFLHLAKKGARTTAAYGPYKNAKEECREEAVAKYPHRIAAGLNVFGYEEVSNKEEFHAKLINALKKSPVAMVIHASDALQFWGKKHYTPANCSFETKINHAVVLVGVGKDAEGRFWAIRNSWGDTWGDGTGHFKMERHPTENTCGYQIGAFTTDVL